MTSQRRPLLSAMPSPYVVKGFHRRLKQLAYTTYLHSSLPLLGIGDFDPSVVVFHSWFQLFLSMRYLRWIAWIISSDLLPASSLPWGPRTSYCARALSDSSLRDAELISLLEAVVLRNLQRSSNIVFQERTRKKKKKKNKHLARHRARSWLSMDENPDGTTRPLSAASHSPSHGSTSIFPSDYIRGFSSFLAAA